MEILRVYADTSVFGGAFDKEFETPSRMFFDQVRQEKFRLVVSALVRYEIGGAPQDVRDLFADIVPIAEAPEIPHSALVLRREYLRAGIVGHASLADALHVAAATVLQCQAIVSWNFRHIVHFQKIQLYNAVNKAQGYSQIAIHTPQEVIRYEEDF